MPRWFSSRTIEERGGERVQRPSIPLELAIGGMGAALPSETPQFMKGLHPGTGEHAVLCVDRTKEPLATLQNESRVRRAGPITLFMLAAAQQALAANPSIHRNHLGIVAAFNTGAIVPTRRFFEGVVKAGQRFASPNLFPETFSIRQPAMSRLYSEWLGHAIRSLVTTTAWSMESAWRRRGWRIDWWNTCW